MSEGLSLLLVAILVFLILLSGFFSGSETGMTSLNRYRLRHMARKNHPGAKRVERLMQRPDRLLGVILLGNTFANILASAMATLLAAQYWGDTGVWIATVVLTLIILIFSETAPKTLAVLYPERVAYPASPILAFLLIVLYPLVWLINTVANALLKLFGVQVGKRSSEPLNHEELRSVVNEAKGKISSSYQDMLLRILDLEQETVEDAMIPRADIYGIDVEQSWDNIVAKLIACPHRYVPLYVENIDQALGMVSIRRALTLLANQKLDKPALLQIVEDIYFIPDTGKLSQQLRNFQRLRRYVGMVVDEYGDIQGMVSLKDIVEEIVGEFEQGANDEGDLISIEDDGSVLVDGGIYIRDLNRITEWDLPVAGPKTLSGLIIEYLEMMPQSRMSVRIQGYPMEIEELAGNTIQKVRVWPDLCQAEATM